MNFRIIPLILLLLSLTARGQHLSPLSPKPDWSQLNAYQQTITRTEFTRLLDQVYAPDGAWHDTIRITDDTAFIKTGGMLSYKLRFATSEAGAKPVPRYWHDATSLAGLKIALDPGHLGGRWAKMEERWFQIDGSAPIMEGDLVLKVARLIAARLTALGATVSFVRDSDEPVTPQRPADLRKAAAVELARQGVRNPADTYAGYADPQKGASIQWNSELLFYRISEIHARAAKVNEKLKPDLVLCLHLDAAPWGDPGHPQLVADSHIHLLVNGCYSAGELGFDDVRFEMLRKLLNRTTGEEVRLSESVAQSLATATALPPFVYHSTNARPVDASNYVWFRNLLASRVYECPVLYIEPYVMNSQVDFDRLQLGDYDGTKVVDGRLVPSLFREYADAVVAGLQTALGK
ncbi:MAG: N-acetylmuramoyl-L-alanine amidase [Chthoniobacteraceae bacterium]